MELYGLRQTWSTRVSSKPPVVGPCLKRREVLFHLTKTHEKHLHIKDAPLHAGGDNFFNGDLDGDVFGTVLKCRAHSIPMSMRYSA